MDWRPLRRLSHRYGRQRDFSRAEESFNAALRISRELGATLHEAEALRLLGVALHVRGSVVKFCAMPTTLAA